MRLGEQHIEQLKRLAVEEAGPHARLRLFGSRLDDAATGGDVDLGCLNYARTFMHEGRLTNGSTLMWSTALTVFLIGLVSGQITGLMYRRNI